MTPPFSARTEFALHPNRLSRALDERRKRGLPVADLTESNPTRAGFDYPAEAILKALRSPAALLYEPVAAGLSHARAAVARHHATRGHVVSPDRITLCASTSEAYSWLFKLLADPGHEVLVPAPCYPLFAYLAALESVRTAYYPLVYDGRWHVDVDALRAAVTPSTRVIVIVNPNNPTGSYLHAAERSAMADLARTHGLALVSDEVFSDYTSDEVFSDYASNTAATTAASDRVPFVAAHDDVLSFSLSGLSKVAALPQMKLGWIVAGGPDPLVREALARLELVADTYLSVSTPIQHAAPALLATADALQSQVRARVAANRAVLATALGSAPAASLLHAEGGWYAVVRFPRTVSEEELVLALLESDGVLVHPGYFFDFPGDGYLVVSLLPAPDLFAAAAGRLAARLAETTQ